MIRAVVGFNGCLILAAAFLAAGPPNLSLGTITRVSPAHSGEDVQQIWTASDPSDSKRVIVCGYDQYSKQNVSTGYVYSSADGGVTWHPAMLENGTKFVSEESCTFDSNGRAYFSAGESDMATGEPRHEWGHLNIFGSSDHGMHWDRLWTREKGWIDWPYFAAEPASKTFPATVVLFGNSGTDKLGHWLTSRPVAIVSHDQGRTFSDLIAPQPPAGLKYVAVWTSGSAVLPNGDLLFSTTAALKDPKSKNRWGWANTGHLNVEVFAVSPAGTVTSRAVIQHVSPATAFTVTIARDASRGRYAGRLYTAWTKWSSKNDRTGTLFLAHSDDQGHHWSSRPISAAGCAGDLKIANAPNGRLGLAWTDSSRRIHFADSQDGGKTFGQSTLVAEHGPGALALRDAIPFNEYWAAAVIAVRARKSPLPYLDQKHLGVSIRMGQPTGLGDFAVASDGEGAFHVFWAQVEADGTHAMFTRSIQVGYSSTTNRMVPAPPAQCYESIAGEQPPLPIPMPKLNPPGERDVSKSFVLHIQNLQYDEATHAVSADVILTNKGKTTVRGLVSFFGLGLHSDYGSIVATNADGMVQAQPFWNAAAVIPAGGLAPGASSKPLTLRFQITHFRILQDSAAGGDAAAMWVRIYQKS